MADSNEPTIREIYRKGKEIVKSRLYIIYKVGKWDVMGQDINLGIDFSKEPSQPLVCPLSLTI